MAIEKLSSRPDVSGTAADTKSASKSIAPRPANAAHTNAAEGALDTPAATSHLSSGGLILGLMQAYETLHPDDAKAFLQSIADKLHADARSGDAFASILNAWGDKFQLAADSGDLSKLLPSIAPSAHFGIRAYQAAQPAPDDAATIATVFHNSAPPTSTSDLAAATARLVNTVSDSIRALGAADDAALASSSLAEANPLIAEENAARYVVQERRRYERQRRRRPRARARKFSHPR